MSKDEQHIKVPAKDDDLVAPGPPHRETEDRYTGTGPSHKSAPIQDELHGTGGPGAYKPIKRDADNLPADGDEEEEEDELDDDFSNDGDINLSNPDDEQGEHSGGSHSGQYKPKGPPHRPTASARPRPVRPR